MSEVLAVKAYDTSSEKTEVFVDGAPIGFIRPRG